MPASPALSPSPSSAPSSSPSGSSRLGRLRFPLALALLSLGALGADVSPCGSPRRSQRALTPPPPAPTTKSAESTEPLRACCQQCAAAASRDPSGVDLRVQPCSKYRGPLPDGSPGLDQACAALLTEKQLTIGACQQQAVPQ